MSATTEKGAVTNSSYSMVWRIRLHEAKQNSESRVMVLSTAKYDKVAPVPASQRIIHYTTNRLSLLLNASTKFSNLEQVKFTYVTSHTLCISSVC